MWLQPDTCHRYFCSEISLACTTLTGDRDIIHGAGLRLFHRLHASGPIGVSARADYFSEVSGYLHGAGPRSAFLAARVVEIVLVIQQG